MLLRKVVFAKLIEIEKCYFAQCQQFAISTFQGAGGIVLFVVDA